MEALIPRDRHALISQLDDDSISIRDYGDSVGRLRQESQLRVIRSASRSRLGPDTGPSRKVRAVWRMCRLQNPGKECRPSLLPSATWLFSTATSTVWRRRALTTADAI
jgi:hypothetical protein